MIIAALLIMCSTIIICTLIRYVCIWNCQSVEYKLYRAQNNMTARFCIRKKFYKSKGAYDGPDFWGYVVFDIKANNPFTGEGGNTNFTIYKNRNEAEKVLQEINELYGN